MKPLAFHHPNRLRRAQGFTILELMVVVSIVAVLAALAAPSFKDFVLGQRVKNASFDLASNLLLARSEAIKRNTNVTLAPTDTSAGWAGGWKVTFTVASVTTTLVEQVAYPGLTLTGPSSPASVVYQGTSGRPGAGKASFQLSGGSTSRCVTVDLSGLTSTKTGACS
jgi:type IV fimbrial biogenesis protein FimT